MHLFMSISGTELPSTYLLLTLVLSALVLMSIWREMSTLNGPMFLTRSGSALAFVSSRIVAVVFSTAMLADSGSPPVVYTILNLTGLLLAAICVPSAVKSYKVVDKEDSPEVQREVLQRWEMLERRRLLRSALIAAGVGVVVAAMVAVVSRASLSFSDFVNIVLFVATARVTASLFQASSEAIQEIKPSLLALMGFLTLSWVMVAIAALTDGATAHYMLLGSRVADVFAWMSVLVALQANYVVLGSYHKSRAEETGEVLEKTKEELQSVNNVATALHEDTNDAIYRIQQQLLEVSKRAESLEKILEIGMTIQKRKSLDDLLTMIAELIRDNLGFNTVILRLHNERTHSFETKAHVGLSEDARDAVVNYRKPMSEFKTMLSNATRVGGSYLVPDERDDEHGAADEGVVVGSNWESISRIIVPLLDDESNAVGYFTVEEPASLQLSVVESVDSLEMIASLAVIAIRNARFLRDVADKNEKLKLYAEKLSSLNKMKSNFVATISHEFRTPLTSIKAYCETLLRNAEEVDRNIMKEFLVVIDEESDRLMTLIEDILDFSQMESGAIKFERTPCNLNEIVIKAADELSRNFERKQVKVHTHFAEANSLVRAEHDLMRQLVINLLHNASKFTKDGGNVWVRLENDTVAVRLVVEDDGIGIPNDQIEQIFDHFHQADNTSTRKYGGTGMGLAICKNIVDWHDGTIWVENIPSGGARFVVVIPKKQVVVRNHVLGLEGTMRRYEIERYMELLVEMVTELIGVKKASLMLYDQNVNALRVESAIGIDPEVVESAKVAPGDGIAGRVFRDGRSYLVEDIDKDTRVNVKNNDFLYDSRSFLSVPIKDDDSVYGVINVSNPLRKDKFDASDMHLLELFANRIAVAVNRLGDFISSSDQFESVRDAFKAMLDAKRFVCDSSVSVLQRTLVGTCERLGLSTEETARVQYVFNVYDLGLAKQGYVMVKKPTPLTADDRREVERHTIVGTEMLEPIETATHVRDAVLYHHENWDGSGYPGKLAREAIPVEARIIRIADTFRALISPRPYQKQFRIDEAIDVVRGGAGSKFDPKVVEAFVAAIKDHEADLDRNANPQEVAVTGANINESLQLSKEDR